MSGPYIRDLEVSTNHNYSLCFQLRFLSLLLKRPFSMVFSLIEILLRLSTAKYWSESHFISVRIAVLDISNDQKKL